MHVGASAISGHYIAYVLVDPGVVLNINRKRLVDDMGIEREEQDDSSSGIAAAGVAISNKVEKEDNRVWCYCSEYVFCLLRRMSFSCQCATRSTQIRLATIDEVMQAKAYLCFVSCSLKYHFGSN